VRYLHGKSRDWHLLQLGLSNPHLTLALVHCLQAFFLGGAGSFGVVGLGAAFGISVVKARIPINIGPRRPGVGASNRVFRVQHTSTKKSVP
jgi:hypothetical protein